MNKMKFYQLIEQQYKDYKNEINTMISTTCDGCPCQTLRNEVFGPYEQTGCADEMTYLIEKYKIDGNAYLCESSMIAALKIAKKMAENFNRI